MEESGNKSLENLKTCRYWPLLSFQNIKSGVDGIPQDAFTKVNKKCGRLPFVCIVNALPCDLVHVIFQKMLDENEKAIDFCNNMRIICFFEKYQEMITEKKKYPLYCGPAGSFIADFYNIPQEQRELLESVQLTQSSSTPLITQEHYDELCTLPEDIRIKFLQGKSVNVTHVKEEVFSPKGTNFFTPYYFGPLLLLLGCKYYTGEADLTQCCEVVLGAVVFAHCMSRLSYYTNAFSTRLLCYIAKPKQKTL